MSTIVDRILEQIGDSELLNKLLSIPKSDLNSLLLKMNQIHAGDISPADIVKAFSANRFSTPSEIDPLEYHLLETEFLLLAQKNSINGILLSPAAPLASSSAFGCVDQNNVVSAARGVEILSDPTNMLAIIIANKLKNNEVCNKTPIHYCATTRVLRAQQFPKSKKYTSHFGVFCIVSSGKDSGSYTCEKSLLVKQLSYYKQLLLEKYSAKLTVTLRKRSGYIDGDGFFDSMTQLFSDELPDVPISLDLAREDNNYYKGINFQLFMDSGNESIEIGDGGFVDWIQRMTGNKKERCLISGIGIDRLLLL